MFPVKISDGEVLDIKRISKTKYSIFIKNNIWHKEFSFTYTDRKEKWDLREFGDVQLLGMHANYFYVQNYLIPV